MVRGWLARLLTGMDVAELTESRDHAVSMAMELRVQVLELESELVALHAALVDAEALLGLDPER